MTPFSFSCKVLALLAFLCLQTPGRLKAGDFPDLPSEATASLVRQAQDAANALDFDRAETLTAGALAAAPLDPLPAVFWCGILVTRAQEEVVFAGKPGQDVFGRFDKVCAQALDLAQRYGQARPGPRAKLYLASIIGARAMIKLYQKSYVGSYMDGQTAAGLLKEALRDDPSLADAYLILGQYEYYCGHLAGLLQFFLNLHGDSSKGKAMLEVCAQKGSFGALPARLCLAKIYSTEEPDYARGLPYVQDLRCQYPDNYCFVRYAVNEALGLGLDKPRARQLLQDVCDQWDAGWRPPAYIKLDLESARQKLARAAASENR